MAKTPKWKIGLGLEPEDFPKYSKENVGQLYDIYKAMRKQYISRKNAFRRKDIISHAQRRYEREVTRELAKDENHLYNKLVREIALLQKFFKSETATVAGTREVNRREDLRIFGPAGRSKTKPAHTMTSAEREKYWDLHDEWYSQLYSSNTDLASSQIQMSLGDLIINSDEFNEATLTEKLEQLRQHARGDLIVNEETGRNEVLSGTRYGST